ncbi:hypothetical protein [Paenibacillus sanguinis]|uniref:hypothetical protein n=1 Tax=Paenibacillus sanguinis TaxID=225906 RepID=UPI000376CDA7|nr:hypothetical protein [Paenibacillus sanguinis]
MKRWLFVGKSDKRDLLLYLCSALAATGTKVLLADGTENRKYRYALGGNDSGLAVTEFCGFDVIACPLTAAQASMKKPGGETANAYDYELYDLESLNGFGPEWFATADEIIWVTSYDRYEVEASAQWFGTLLHLWPELRGMTVRPVYIRTVDCYLSSDYIMSFMDGLALEWRKDGIRIPWNELNLAVQLENEHAGRLRLSHLSRSYKRALRQLLHDLAGWESTMAKKALRQAERRQA